VIRGALAGAVAAAVWAAAEPAAGRLFGTPPGYSDARLVGGLVTRDGARWREVGLAAHVLNGAAFGAVFAAAGGRGWKQGVLAAKLENMALWPAMAAVDRLHPDRRSGAWPRLLTSPRVFAYEAAVHALFGAVLGALLRDGEG
jgi:hypothetical protein